jgi:5-methylcytosine-specific restriction endonuclease McrA
MKTCRGCGQSKPSNAFYPSQWIPGSTRRRGDGLRAFCKLCEQNKRRVHFRSLSKERQAEIRATRNRSNRKWDKKRPFYIKASKANLHAQRVGATGVVTEQEVADVWRAWKGLCWCCGQDAAKVDHFRPINQTGGGTNTKDNIRPICRECNQKRSHKWHGEAIAMKEAKMLKRLKALLNEAEGT